MTMTGAVIGTMAYMAPEQALGHRVGAPADVYAASLVLYEMLTGRNPIAGGGPAATARRAASADVPSLAGMRPDLPRPITDAVMRGLARDPGRRPSAVDLRDALRGGGGLARKTRAMTRGGGLVSAAGAGALVWLGADAATGLDPLAVAAMAVAAAVLGAWHPRTALLVAGGLGLAAVGRWSPGAAALIAVLALLVAVPAIGARRLLMAPAAAPALAAAGLVPLYPAGCAMIRSVAMRAWLGIAGVLALLVWEITHAGGVLVDAATATGITDALAGERSPVVAATEVVEGLGGDPGLLVRCGVIVAAALLARPLLAGPTRTRLVGAVAWCALVAAGLAASSPDPRRRRGGDRSRSRRRARGRGAALATPPRPGRAPPVRYAARSDMSVLRNIERGIEGLFERGFRRAFKSSLQPVELARKLAREMDDHKTVSVSRVYGPNEFHVFLAPDDRAAFESYESALTAELETYLEAHAAGAGLSLVARPVVSFETDADLRAGEFGISCRMAEDVPEAPDAERRSPSPRRRRSWRPPRRRRRRRRPARRGPQPGTRRRQRDPGALARRRAPGRAGAFDRRGRRPPPRGAGGDRARPQP